MFTPEVGAAIMSDWLERQKALFEALAPKETKPPAESKPDKSALKPEEVWHSYMDFWAAFAKAVPTQAGALDVGALETLGDPTASARNALGPSDPKTRLANPPSFATLWDWDQKTFKAYGAWLTLQQAIAAQRALVDAAWADALTRFQELISRPADDAHPAITSWRAGLDLWLATANTRLLEMQRSEQFLEAQRRLLAASMDYQLKLREMAEELCELYQVPGRGEVDELARMLHELRRDVRALKRAAKVSDETSVPN
jgi:polyhydroxyalkanoate synthase subunit PhaE